MRGNVNDLAEQLRDVFAAELVTIGRPADTALVHPGNMVPQYGCQIAAVRVVSVLAVEVKSPKCPPEWSVIYEMSIDRCYPNTENNAMPAPADLEEANRGALADAAAMRAAAANAWPARLRRRAGTWTPRGPAGGIYGGAMQVTALGLTLC